MEVQKKSKEQPTNPFKANQSKLEEKIKMYTNKGCDKESYNEKQKEIALQRHVYQKLQKKGMGETDVARLLELTLADVREQTNIKSSLESRVGIILALWSGLFALLIQQGILKTMLCEIISNVNVSIGERLFTVVLMLALFISGICSLMCIYKTIKCGQYLKFTFDDRELNFRLAVDDKNIAIAELLDSYTKIWTENERLNEIKAQNYENMIFCTAVFTFLIILSHLITW